MRKILSTVLCLILAVSSAAIPVAAESDSSKETNKVQVSESKVALVDTATDLVKMSLSDVIDMFGGEFDVKTSHLNQNVVYDLGNFAYITNEDVLPGMLIYTDYFLGTQEDFDSNFELTNTAAEKVKSELLKGNNNITRIVAQKNAKFDSKISADMNYKQMKEVIGDFECFTNSGHGTYFMNTEPTGGYSVLCSFNYTTNIQAEDYATIDSKIMEDNNPNLDFILVNPNYTTIYKTSAINTPSEKTYTAVDLLDKSIADIIELLGGDYEVGGYTNDDNEKLFLNAYIYNNEQIPGLKIYVSNPLPVPISDNTGRILTTISEEFKNSLKTDQSKPLCISVRDNGKLDNNISANMRYNDLTPYYGNFDITLSVSANYTVKDEHNNTTALFIFDSDYDTTNQYIPASVAKSNNFKLKHIIAYQGFKSPSVSSNTNNGNSGSSTGTSTNSATTGTTTGKSGSTSSTSSTVTSPKTGAKSPIFGSMALVVLGGAVAGVLSKKLKEDI